MLHGDEFDSVIKASPLLEALGNRAYAFVLKLNRYVNLLRRAFGSPYWSIAAYLKHKVKNAVKYIANFERALAQEARRRGLDGAICGHIHRAEISQIDGVLYCNDGDWVESCTTLTEDFQGRLSLLRWTESKEVITHSGALAPCRSSRRREDSDRHRRVAAADQRRRPDPEHDGADAARRRSRRPRDRAQSVPHVSLSDVSGDPPGVVSVSPTGRAAERFRPGLHSHRD